MRTYSLLKTEIGKEKYLDKILNLESRITLTKTRLSNHALMIEQGRHLKIHKTQRYLFLICKKYRAYIMFGVKINYKITSFMWNEEMLELIRN